MPASWALTPSYFLVFAFLCGVVGFRIGWRMKHRFALPLAQGFLGWLMFLLAWTTVGAGWSAASVGAWAIGTTVASVYVFLGHPKETDERVIRAAEYRVSMLAWLESRRICLRPAALDDRSTPARGDLVRRGRDRQREPRIYRHGRHSSQFHERLCGHADPRGTTPWPRGAPRLEPLERGTCRSLRDDRSRSIVADVPATRSGRGHGGRERARDRRRDRSWARRDVEARAVAPLRARPAGCDRSRSGQGQPFVGGSAILPIIPP